MSSLVTGLLSLCLVCPLCPVVTPDSIGIRQLLIEDREQLSEPRSRHPQTAAFLPVAKTSLPHVVLTEDEQRAHPTRSGLVTLIRGRCQELRKSRQRDLDIIDRGNQAGLFGRLRKRLLHLRIPVTPGIEEIPGRAKPDTARPDCKDERCPVKPRKVDE